MPGHSESQAVGFPLNPSLALPLLPEWAGYLWENGRTHELIILLNEGEGQGYAA